jgi:hypothetical protein
MVKFYPKISTKICKKLLLWGIFLFFSFIIVSSYIFKLQEGLNTNIDVSNIVTGNVITLDKEYTLGTATTRMPDIYSSVSEPEAVLTGNLISHSNSYNGPAGFLGGGTLTTPPITKSINISSSNYPSNSSLVHSPTNK